MIKQYIFLIGLIAGLNMIGIEAGEQTVFNKTETMEVVRPTELTIDPVPVVASQKYKIQFTASTTGPNTIEENRRIRIIRMTKKVSQLQMVFYDQNNDTCGKEIIYILSQKLETYVRVFYPPAKATSCRLFLQPGVTAKLVIKDVQVDTDLEGQERRYLNPHPTFTNGDLNTYGCRTGGGGRFYTRPDGKTVWNTGFIGYSPSFPVEEETFYKFNCRGKRSQAKGWIWINFYNEQNKKLKHARINIGENGAETVLKMPKGTTHVKLQCYYVIIEEFTALPKSI